MKRILKPSQNHKTMDYFSRPEVSNSDLNRLKDMLHPKEDAIDPYNSYRLGTLLDAMVTEPEIVNFLRFTCGEYTYSEAEFENTRAMKRSVMADPLVSNMLKNSSFQEVMVKHDIPFDYDIPFTLSCGCKWDIWMPLFSWGADLKTTTAETQKQFEEAARYFDYDRQRFWYMNIAGSKKDLLIGVSKSNHKVFKIPIERGDAFWQSGKEKALELAYKYWIMFGKI